MIKIQPERTNPHNFMSSPKTATFLAEQPALSVTKPRCKTAVKLRVRGQGGLNPCTSTCRDTGQHPAHTPQPSCTGFACKPAGPSLPLPDEFQTCLSKPSLLEFTYLALNDQSISQLLFSCILPSSFTEQILLD